MPMTISRQSLIAGGLLLISFLVAALSPHGMVWAQTVPRKVREPDQTWVGQRIIMLKGMGEIQSPGPNGQTPRKRIPNIVAPVARVEGEHIWILSPGAVESDGWVARGDALLLDDAVAYFTSLIEREPANWDAYFRRAEAHHALNQRDEAITDYTAAIKLRPKDPFLTMRRARSFHAMKAWDKALTDYDTVIRLDPKSAEAYSIQASIYANCPDTRFRNPQKAIAAARRAIALDKEHPTYLTILAAAYAGAGQWERAIASQKQALASPRFPPGYREEAERQLRQYEQAFATQQATKRPPPL